MPVWTFLLKLIMGIAMPLLFIVLIVALCKQAETTKEDKDSYPELREIIGKYECRNNIFGLVFIIGMLPNMVQGLSEAHSIPRIFGLLGGVLKLVGLIGMHWIYGQRKQAIDRVRAAHITTEI